jgi:glycosyltransferase involved in cell wall biosynthesis
MKISIITVCYNSEKTIADCIHSIVEQTYPDIEYIIIDGKSSDNTLNIIHLFKNKISKIISEKDNGIYDAMNKGLSIATGDIVGILNSDDVYADNYVVEEVVNVFKNKNTDSVYGDLVYVSANDINKVTRKWRSAAYKDGMFLEGWMPPHPTFFVKREMYTKYGQFDTSMKSAADYELMLRFLHRYKISTAYLPKVFVKMRAGGVSNASLLNRIKANIEDRKAWRINGLQPKWYTLYRKPLSKVFQFLK